MSPQTAGSVLMATIVLTLIIGRQAIVPENHGLFLQSIQTVFFISAVLCLSGAYFSWFRGALFRSDIDN
jgi:hypothetical protein